MYVDIVISNTFKLNKHFFIFIFFLFLSWKIMNIIELSLSTSVITPYLRDTLSVSNVTHYAISTRHA